MGRTTGLVAWIAAMLIAILSGLGIGSGGLFVIWLTMIEGIDTVTARGLNLLFFVFSASAALFVHLTRKRIRLSSVLFLGFFASLGTLFGLFISKYIDPTLLKRIFGGMLVVSGAYTLVGNIISMAGKKKARRLSRGENFKF